MSQSEAREIFGEFLMGKRGLDSNMYEAIRVQYLAGENKKNTNIDKE